MNTSEDLQQLIDLIEADAPVPDDISFSPMVGASPPMLKVDQVCQRLSISRSTLYADMARDPAFPRPRKIGAAVRWLEDELEDYVRKLPVADY